MTDNKPNKEPATPNVVLVAGYWLGGWAWRDVEPHLQHAGIATHAVTLPGLDGSAGSENLTLSDHIDFVADLVDAVDGAVVLVGHSGGAAVVQGVVDRRAERIGRVIYVDSGPLRDGVALRPDATTNVPLPPWDEFEADHISIEGLDTATLAEIRRRAVDHPAGVARSPIQLVNPARHAVPASVICTSLPSQTLTAMIDAGHIPSELLSVRDVRYIDLPTGHWPMFSRPMDLANLILAEVQDLVVI